MKVIGLTGGSGSGKSTVATLLQEKGLRVLDADRIYHELLASDPEMNAELADAFGDEILSESGIVDRKKLGALVFGKPDAEARLHILNEITHKYVMVRIRKMLQEARGEGLSIVVLDAPLLFEAGAEVLCDTVIGVIAPTEQRIARLIERDGITHEQARARIAAQHGDDFFRARCDLILENDSDESALLERLMQLL
ncbi:MAG: dephospho-CoA kinase [Ruminococcaceae bacterium]|nr:dephospho-CoA kinase [Oscillospiraceae bacterium]